MSRYAAGCTRLTAEQQRRAREALSDTERATFWALVRLLKQRRKDPPAPEVAAERLEPVHPSVVGRHYVVLRDAGLVSLCGHYKRPRLTPAGTLAAVRGEL